MQTVGLRKKQVVPPAPAELTPELLTAAADAQATVITAGSNAAVATEQGLAKAEHERAKTEAARRKAQQARELQVKRDAILLQEETHRANLERDLAEVRTAQEKLTAVDTAKNARDVAEAQARVDVVEKQLAEAEKQNELEMKKIKGTTTQELTKIEGQQKASDALKVLDTQETERLAQEATNKHQAAMEKLTNTHVEKLGELNSARRVVEEHYYAKAEATQRAHALEKEIAEHKQEMDLSEIKHKQDMEQRKLALEKKVTLGEAENGKVARDTKTKDTQTDIKNRTDTAQVAALEAQVGLKTAAAKGEMARAQNAENTVTADTIRNKITEARALSNAQADGIRAISDAKLTEAQQAERAATAHLKQARSEMAARKAQTPGILQRWKERRAAKSAENVVKTEANAQKTVAEITAAQAEEVKLIAERGKQHTASLAQSAQDARRVNSAIAAEKAAGYEAKAISKLARAKNAGVAWAALGVGAAVTAAAVAWDIVKPKNDNKPRTQMPNDVLTPQDLMMASMANNMGASNPSNRQWAAMVEQQQGINSALQR